MVLLTYPVMGVHHHCGVRGTGVHCAMLAGGEGREENFDVISVGRGVR